MFEYGANTGSYSSCSALLSGKMMIFGGAVDYNFSDQISEVSGCRLTRIGSLPHRVVSPACNIYSMPDERVWICFFYRLLSNGSGCLR